MIKKKVLATYALWLTTLVTLIGITFYLVKKAVTLQTQNITAKKTELIQKVHEARQDLYRQLHTVTSDIEESAYSLTQKDVTHLEQYLKAKAQTLPYISSIGIAFEPYAFDPEKKQFAFYLIKEKNGFKNIDIQKYYNYLDSAWYKQIFDKTTSAWSNPFTEVSTEVSVLRFTVPVTIFDSNINTRKRIGAFFVDISRAKLDQLANETVHETDNYAFILSSKGYLITYPIESYLEEHQTLSQVSHLPGKKEWHTVANTIIKKQGGITTYYDALLNTSFWVAFEPLKIADWFLVYVSPKKSLFDVEESRRLILQIAIALCMLILFLCISFMQYIQLQKRRWITSALVTAAFLLLTLLQLSMILKIGADFHGKIIKNKIDLTRFKLFQEQRDKQLRKPNPIYIPTGIIINTILLHDTNKLEIKGFVCQAYGPDAKDLKKEISFFNTDIVKLKPLYQVEKNGTTAIGWEFSAIINFIFDKTSYPFNKLNLTIDMYHPNFEKNVILTPDFNAYEESEVSKNIGVSKKLVIEKNWKIKDSYFFYSLTDSQFNFGLSNAVRKEDFPNLSFTINATLEVVNSSLAYLLPLIIISVVLFYFLLESNIPFKESAIISQISLIGQVGAIFLALVLAHQTLRNVLKISTISYIEFFYFIMYGFTILIATVCMYIHKPQEATAFGMRMRGALKYFYWPLIFGSVFLTTLYFFY